MHQRRVLGRAPTKGDPVFLTPRGKPWPADTGNVRRIFAPILKAVGIDKVNESGERVVFHSLRHTCATRLARAGWPMAKLQRFMGHADPRTTQRYYDHLEVDDLEASLGLVPDLDAAISGSNLAVASGERASGRRRADVSGD